MLQNADVGQLKQSQILLAGAGAMLLNCLAIVGLQIGTVAFLVISACALVLGFAAAFAPSERSDLPDAPVVRLAHERVGRILGGLAALWAILVPLVIGLLWLILSQVCVLEC